MASKVASRLWVAGALVALLLVPGIIAGSRSHRQQRAGRDAAAVARSPRERAPREGAELRSRLERQRFTAGLTAAQGGALNRAGNFATEVPFDNGAPSGSIPTEPLVGAFLSADPYLDCQPFLTGVQVFPALADPRQISARGSYGAAGLPTDGPDFLLLSTGDPDLPAEGADVDFGDPGCAGDNVQIVFTFDFPDLGGGVSPVNSIKFDFDFFSYEFPEFVGVGFNDYVFAYVDAPVPVPLLDAACNAPLGFEGGGCLVTFDGEGQPTNVDNVFFQSCDQLGCDVGGLPGWESTFVEVPGDDSGRTGTLTTCTPTSCTIPVSPGVHTLTLMVGDSGDGIYTTAGLFDNLRCFADLECEEPTTEPVFLPPLCERILDEGSTPEVAQGHATVGEDGASIVSVVPVTLDNVTFDSDPGGEGVTEVSFTLSVIDGTLDAQGVVVVTDSNDESCTFEADFHGLAEGAAEGEVICSGDGVIVQISNPDTPGGVASCSATGQGEGEPPLPLGFAGSSEGDPFPCQVYTVDSSVANSTQIVLKKDGVCDTNLRLLFSRSSDGGETFPPFFDVTQSVGCITDIIPDPTVLSGTTLWSPVKITCGTLVLDCSDPALDGLDQDADGLPFCQDGQIVDCNDANPNIPVAWESGMRCNGLDDDCDGVVDEMCDDEDDDDEDDEQGDEDEDGD